MNIQNLTPGTQIIETDNGTEFLHTVKHVGAAWIFTDQSCFRFDDPTIRPAN